MTQAMHTIHMVPAVATAPGLAFAQTLRPPVEALDKSIREATERCRDASDGSRFQSQSNRLNETQITTAMNQLAEARRTLDHFGVSHYEFEFFRRGIKLASETFEDLLLVVQKAQTVRRRPYEDPWIFCDAKISQRKKAHVTFSGYSPLPSFFGLALGGIVESAFQAAGLKLKLSYERNIADQVGLGLLTALDVYEGRECLVNPKHSLLPHKAYRVEDMSEGGKTKAFSARIYVASRYLPVLYP